jgi:hypothetical protein
MGYNEKPKKSLQFLLMWPNLGVPVILKSQVFVTVHVFGGTGKLNYTHKGNGRSYRCHKHWVVEGGSC